MISKLIILISIFQICIYLISDKMKLNYSRILVLYLFLIGYFFFLPKFFYPEPDPNGINCGMPILGITLVFWIIGGGIATTIHVIYFLVKKIVRRFRYWRIFDFKYLKMKFSFQVKNGYAACAAFGCHEK